MNHQQPDTKTKINYAIIGLLIVLFFIPALAAYDLESIESVTIIGSKEDARNIAGSGAVISNDDLQ